MNRKNGRNKSRKNIQQCWKVEIPNKDRRRYKCREDLRCKEKTALREERGALQRKDGSGWRKNYILIRGKNERWKKRENVWGRRQPTEDSGMGGLKIQDWRSYYRNEMVQDAKEKTGRGRKERQDGWQKEDRQKEGKRKKRSKSGWNRKIRERERRYKW